MNVDLKFILFFIVSIILYYAIGGVVFTSLFFIISLMFFLGIISMVFYTVKITGKMENVREACEVFDTGKLNVTVYNDTRIFLPYARVINEGEEVETRSIRAKSRMQTQLMFYFARRGIYEFKEMYLEFRDIFNIFTLKKSIDAVKVRVYPMVREIRNETFDKGLRNDGIKYARSRVEDIYNTRELRKYSPGDGLKRIHWKVSAKHGELYVKIGEETSGIGYLLIVDMNRDIFNQSEDGSKEESLIAQALGVSKFLLKAGKEHKVILNGLERRTFDIRSEKNFDSLLEYLVEHDSLGDKPMYGFLNEKAEIFRSASSIILFTGDFDDYVAREVVRLKNRYNLITWYAFSKDREEEITNEGITMRYLEE